MLARMTSALVSDLNSAHVIDLIDKVRREVGRFYVTTALINVGLALATGCAMMWCGMPNPFLWGTVAGVLNFIPYAGPTTTLVLLSSVAFVSFDGFEHVGPRGVRPQVEFRIQGEELECVVVMRARGGRARSHVADASA